MDPKTILSKTSKGVFEVNNKSIRLPRKYGLVFLAVDGRSPVSDLGKKTGMDDSSLLQVLHRLMADGYVKIFYEPRDEELSYTDRDLDFTTQR